MTKRPAPIGDGKSASGAEARRFGSTAMSSNRFSGSFGLGGPKDWIQGTPFTTTNVSKSTPTKRAAAHRCTPAIKNRAAAK
jgi:hypothetical protein